MTVINFDEIIGKGNNYITDNIFMMISYLFQSSVNSDLDAFIELKKRSEYFDEFIIDYNRFLNNYTIYSFPINRYSSKDKSTKYINVTGVGVDEDASKPIFIWRQMSNINLKINNNFLEVKKTY